LRGYHGKYSTSQQHSTPQGQDGGEHGSVAASSSGFQMLHIDPPQWTTASNFEVPVAAYHNDFMVGFQTHL
jgi:hypothetical protein